MISFKNAIVNEPIENYPDLTAELGDWEMDGNYEAGITFNTDAGPVLSANDARKLAKWLVRAADILDGEKGAKKAPKKRQHYEEDDDETGGYRV